MLTCNVDESICEEVWENIVKSFEDSMNQFISRGKPNMIHHKPIPVNVQGPSANDMVPVMSFLETNNISFMSSVMETETVSVF